MTKADKEGQRKAPILRFKGFTDDWEQRKLGNLFNERKEKSTKGELLSVTLSNGVTKFSDLNKKDNSNIKSGNYKVVKKNDIPYNSMRMWQGASGVSSYDGIVSPAYTVLVPNRNSNSNFYAVLFKKKSILNLFTRFSQGLTSDTWNLKYPILKDIIVPFTNLEEQKRIFKIFNVINNLLALYDRKLKLLSQIKKYFLDNLFAKKEYPNLRFKGFTDAWEQRKLSSILIERKDLSTESKQFPLSSFIQEKGVVPKSQRYDRSFLVKDSSKKYKVTKFGDFIYSSNNLDTGSIGLNSYGNAVISPVYSVFSSKNSNILETNFVNLLFQQNFYKNKMLRFRQGVMYGQLKIKEDDFLKVKVNVPSQIEIKNIINLFSKIESYATLLENKKKQLVQIKNTLLNTMFI